MNTCYKHEFGECCCGCHFLRKVMKHPMNTLPEFNGRITEQVVFDNKPLYVCTVTYDDGSNYGEALAFTTEHGLCEFYTPKKITL